MTHFSERPYEDVFIADICREAGVAHGLVSYYFGGKKGLFAAAVKQAWQEMLDHERPTDLEVAASDRVRGYIRRHFEYVEQHPKRFTVLMHSTSADPQIREVAQTAQGTALMELMSTLGCPINPPPKLRLAIMGWAGFLDRATMDWLLHDKPTMDEVAEMCRETLVLVIRVANGVRFDEMTDEQALLQVSRLD